MIQDMYDAIDLLDIEYKSEFHDEPRATRIGTQVSMGS
jgi:hypothetical protein